MGLFLTLAAVLLFPPQGAPSSQPAGPWQALQFLVGDWIAEGSGEPGLGSGGFSFHLNLDGKILVRKNRADYPAAKDRPAFSHQDLMVVYPDAKPGEFRAIYFDNEGHVIQYTATIAAAGKAEFVSAAIPESPRFRLIYEKLADGNLQVKFEIAPPGKPDSFSTYVQATARRKAAP